jgi:hypothetical protein
MFQTNSFKKCIIAQYNRQLNIAMNLNRRQLDDLILKKSDVSKDKLKPKFLQKEKISIIILS